jgi:putative heme transporter
MRRPDPEPAPELVMLAAVVDPAADRAPDPDQAVRYGLRLAAGYAWRALVVAIAAYLVLIGVERIQFVAISIFVGLVITAVLRPLTNLLARVLPRGLAVALTMVLAIAALLGLFAFVATSIAGQASGLTAQFNRGITHIQTTLQGKPFHLKDVDLTKATDQAKTWISAHQGSIVHEVLGGAGVAAQLLSGLALAAFCSIFFLHSGDRMWRWFLDQVPVERVRWNAAGQAAWHTFAGYTRGIVIVAATNAVLVCIALFSLRVPLALPLSLLVFFAAFIPLVGSAAALGVATVVALASRGPWIAVAVLVLIVIIGQIEGHLLHPLVMSRAVRLHPIVVALSVATGTILDGIVGAVVAVPLVSVAWSVVTSLRSQPGGICPTSPDSPDPAAALDPSVHSDG